RVGRPRPPPHHGPARRRRPPGRPGGHRLSPGLPIGATGTTGWRIWAAHRSAVLDPCGASSLPPRPPKSACAMVSGLRSRTRSGRLLILAVLVVVAVVLPAGAALLDRRDPAALEPRTP